MNTLQLITKIAESSEIENVVILDGSEDCDCNLHPMDAIGYLCNQHPQEVNWRIDNLIKDKTLIVNL